ncbi:phage antirepressor KilAC domain-containing protein [Xenorhabdus doucetiae]|uniref:phage antirepressor KilAC domain-containing protein n=1 Tax=Xenorhabdus doucetiae TaxID=351671 RepID=UPI002B415148|nr:phage antirepressor KilAC domain-containing protein [Xenorhabdus sp. 18]
MKIKHNKSKTPTAATIGASKHHLPNEINNMNNIANKNLPVIAGVEITTDAEGRFNLNALHKASGEGEHKRPSKWLATEQANELVAELKEQSPVSGLGQEVVKSVRGGVNPGTFAHELLAVEYAGWISPKFRLQVNQTFIDYRSGKLAPVNVDPMRVLGDPDALRSILLTYTEKVIVLEDKVAEMEPDVAAYERIAKKANGSMCITDTAKHLQMKPKSLFEMPSANKWIYRRLGKKNWVAYQDKLQQGLLEHKITTVTADDGTERIHEQVLVTAKGIAKLAKQLDEIFQL